MTEATPPPGLGPILEHVLPNRVPAAPGRFATFPDWIPQKPVAIRSIAITPVDRDVGLDVAGLTVGITTYALDNGAEPGRFVLPLHEPSDPPELFVRDGLGYVLARPGERVIVLVGNQIGRGKPHGDAIEVGVAIHYAEVRGNEETAS